MPVGNGNAEVALELERVRGKLPELFALEDTFFQMINRKQKDKVSYRPERIPFETISGVKGRTPDLDGGDLGRGGGPQTVYGSLAPVQKEWIIEWTKRAEIATDSREKSVEDYAKLILKVHMKSANNDMDSLVEYGDGADTVGIVTPNVNVAGAPFYDSTNLIYYVDKATRFRAGADYDQYNGGPGTAISGTITLKGVDYVNNALYLTATPTTAPTSGAYLIFNNSTGVAGSGINGFTALNSITNTGSFMGVSKAANPGAFVTPAINANGSALTPSIARLLLNQLIISAGVDETNPDDYVFHGDLAQKAAWENTALNITNIYQTGNATGHDTLASRASQVSNIGGIRLMATRKAIPGRLDLVNLDSWFVNIVQDMDYYTAGSVETFWPMGASGGIASAFLKYLIWVGNIGCDNPKKNGVIYGLATPAGY